MSRKTEVKIQYQKTKLLIIGLILSFSIILTLSFLIFAEYLNDPASPQLGPIRLPQLPTSPEVNTSTSPPPKFNLPTPTALPTLTKEQYEILIEELGKLAGSEEALEEIRGR